jgi:Arc/MetJ family transcription regulator
MAKPGKPGASGARIRKNIDIDAAKLAAARRILGAPNDTATVDQALDDVIFVHELRSGLRKLGAAGGLADYDAQSTKVERVPRVADE